MRHRNQFGLAICMATLSIMLFACGDDSGSSGSTKVLCGTQECTAEQKCVENVCVDLCGEDVCTAEQVCNEETKQCEAKGGGEPETDACDNKCTAEQVCNKETKQCEAKGGGEPETDECGNKCTGEQTCNKETKQCENKPVVEDPCAKCGSDEECKDNQCVKKASCKDTGCPEGQICVGDVCKESGTPETDPCENKTCENSNEECYKGDCVNKCDRKTCPDGQECNRESGECQTYDPCSKISCNTGFTCIGTSCIADVCIEGGKEKECGSGQKCNPADGQCIDDGCADLTCESHEICVKGFCVDKLCNENSVICNEGRTCLKGECVDNECLDKTCDGDLKCVKGECMYEACINVEACPEGRVCGASGECEFVVPPAITVPLAEDDDYQTDERGDTALVKVQINNKPTQPVYIVCEVSSSSPYPEASTNCEAIVFNEENWQDTQTIVVTGLADHAMDGDQTYRIRIETVSAEAAFNGLKTETVPLENVDIDVAEYVVGIPDGGIVTGKQHD